MVVPTRVWKYSHSLGLAGLASGACSVTQGVPAMALTAVEHDREAVTEVSAGGECLVVAMGAETLHEEIGKGLDGAAVEQVADGAADGYALNAQEPLPADAP